MEVQRIILILILIILMILSWLGGLDFKVKPTVETPIKVRICIPETEWGD